MEPNVGTVSGPRDDQRIVFGVDVESDHRAHVQQDRCRRPGLRRTGRGIRDRYRHAGPAQAREQLWGPTREVRCGGERAVHQRVDHIPAAVAGCARRDNGGVVWPYGAVVVAQRVIATHGLAERADTPSRPQIRSHDQVQVAVRTVGVCDPRPECMTGIRGQRVDRSPGPVETEDVVPPLVPERRVELIAEALGASSERGSVMTESHWAGEVSAADERGKRVALNLDERDRCVRDLAAGGTDAVPRVLPALVAEPTGFASGVRDEPLVIEKLLEPVEGAIDCRSQGLEIGRGQRSPPPGLGGQHDEQGRCVDGPVIPAPSGEGSSAAVAAQFMEDLARLLLCGGIVNRALQIGEGEQHAASEGCVERQRHPRGEE